MITAYVYDCDKDIICAVKAENELRCECLIEDLGYTSDDYQVSYSAKGLNITNHSELIEVKKLEKPKSQELEIESGYGFIVIDGLTVRGCIDEDNKTMSLLDIIQDEGNEEIFEELGTIHCTMLLCQAAEEKGYTITDNDYTD